MDILDNNEAVSTPVLEDLIEARPLGMIPAPEASQRNTAAVTSLLSDPEQAMTNYGNIKNELSQGDQTTYNRLDTDIQTKAKQGDLASVMNILGDRNVPLAQKQQIVASLKNAPLLTDKFTLMQTNLLAKGSADETPDSERARISTADVIDEVMQSRAQIQGIVNGLRQDHEGSNLFTQFLNHSSGLIPFSDANVTDKVMTELSKETGIDRKWWQHFDTVLLRPGTTKRAMQEHIASLPPEKRVVFAQTVANAVKNKSGLLFGTDNQYRAYTMVQDLLQPDSYGVGGELIDNTVALFDALGAKGLMDGTVAATKAIRGGLPKGLKPAPTTGGAPGSQGVNAAGDEAVNASGAYAGKAAKPQGVEDVAFNEIQNANGKLVQDTAAPSSQLANPQLKLAAPVDRISEPSLVAKQVESRAETVKRITTNQAVRDVNPATPAEIAQQSNPDTARSFFEVAYKGQSDEAAQAVAGVSRDQAIINGKVPQATTGVDGAVDSRVNDVDKNIRLSPGAEAAFMDSSVSGLTGAEKAAARANVVNDFANVDGLVINDAMSSFTFDGTRAKVGAVYEVPGGSFSNAQEAFDQAKFALRKYGIRDEDIQVLGKDGISHVPVDKAITAEGDYKIRVNIDWETGSGDLDEFSKLTVKNNWFDRMATTNGNQGSLTRHIFDAASLLDPTITSSATVAKDYAAKFDKVLLQNAGDFASEVGKMKPPRREKIFAYLREANHNGIDFDQVDLVARGFSASEINTVSKWRTFWDDHFYLENLDVVRTLRANGFQKFENTNTKLYARPVPKNQNVGAFYDPQTDAVRYFQAGELDTLYNNGGTIAKLRRPTSFGADRTEYMIARNSPTEYFQGIRDSEKALNYRPGYFQVQYKAPKFIDEIEVDSAGREIGRKAVATAEDTAQANLAAKRLGNQTGNRYEVRNEDKGGRRGGDTDWDLNSAGGRISQRHRGKLLEDGSSNNLFGESHVVNPAESAIRASRSISMRTVQRPMLENATERMLAQYERVMPKDEFGRPRFPASAAEIGGKGEKASKEVADARTTWEYINYLRNGYVNGMDDAIKAGWNAIADTASEHGLTTIERGARALGDVNVSTNAKKFVFDAYIASNPMRQWVVQTAQMYRTVAYNPQGWATGAVQKHAIDFWNNFGLGGKPTQFTDFVTRSGVMQAVDQHNLVSDQLRVIADQSNRLKHAADVALNTARKVGFDLGENQNMIMHMAAVWDRYERLGKNMASREVQEAAHSEARALSYEMNAAGDMPYTRTSAAAVMQFLQMPHKALLNYTNRKLPVAMRARMAVMDGVLYGGSFAAAITAINGDLMPEDPLARDILNNGLVSMFYNGVLNRMYEGSHEADFSSLRPVDLESWAKMASSFWTEGVAGAIAQSPAYTLLAKDGGRVPQAMASISRFFGLRKDFDDNNPTTFVGMLGDIAEISSGYNNAHKAWLAYTMGERRDSYGAVIDQNTTTGDSIAQLFGFGSQEAAQRFRLSRELSADLKSHDDDVKSVYKSIKRYYADKLENDPQADLNRLTGITAAALRYYQDDPKAMAVLQGEIRKDFGKGTPEARLMQLILAKAGLPGTNNMENEIERGQFSDEDKDKMRRAIKHTKDAMADLEQHNKGK